MNEQTKNIFRIISAVIILIIISCLDAEGYLRLVLYIVPYLIAGYDVLLEALEGIREHEIFDENFLMAAATIGALVLGEYAEASAVMIFYKLGELFEDYASDRSRKNIIALMDLRPDYANIERNGVIERADPAEVPEGSVIVIRPGEKVPVDGVIIEGHSSIDTKALTGESLPRDAGEGDSVLSGSINISGVLRVKTSCRFQDSTASKILALVEESSANKSRSEKFITRFAGIYTPAVCICALALFLIPTLINPSDFQIWLYRALTFLVISCPCALVISIPLTFFAGIGASGRRGILVKGSNFLEMLSDLSCVVFDKTGTLTRGVFEVTAVHPEIIGGNELLHLAAHVERYSLHPAADALRRAYPSESDSCRVDEAEELAGYGVRAKVNGKMICAGNSKLMDLAGAEWHSCNKPGTIIHVAVDGIYAGHVVISDVLKPSAKDAVDALRSEGVRRIAMLTGDTKASAEEAAESLGIDEVYSELLPADKAEKVREFMTSGGHVAFVGDGINDAPVLALADVGIAMGAVGSDAAVEASDVVLMDDDPLKIPEAVNISRRTMLIVRENIYFSAGVKLLCLLLGAIGIADMWLAVFADVGVMVIAVANAMRAMYVKGKR